jgi:NarL family two-component system sensor histidine kinase LiaS
LIDQDPEAAQKHLDQAEQLTRQTQAELAMIIRELRPATLGISGLAPAIREQLEEWSRLNNIGVKVQIKEERRLPNEIEQCLFRVIQEALSNIARHSHADQVEFEMAYDEHNVTLSISDNGKGFDVAAVKDQGVGLRNMRERILNLGGEFRVESSHGQGTRLVARCPINIGESL